ncbi:putative gustatory receptor 36c [Drosophila teissieri]|uniref:putative gustatory receptor 36c n=1 Tax=Drosophila teissieri TaxID=7243 RepID=UPI001CBA2F64|nr:putative gustatory receptor 36c [Drosophila teissieri]
MDLESFLLGAVYYYGLFIGLSTFEFDWNTGRVFTSKWSTLYPIATDSCIFILYMYHWTGNINIANGIFSKASLLHEYVVIIITGLKILTGLFTLIHRWYQRGEMMDLAAKVIRMFMARPQVKRMSRWGILTKFISGSLTDALQMAIFLNTMSRVDPQSFLGLGLQYWMSAILNIAMVQQYMIILFIRTQFQLLNTELRQVVEEARELQLNPRHQGVFMTRCCSLADQLENIARVQSQLQTIVSQLEKAFAIRGALIYGGYYLSSVGNSYMAYSILKHGYENMNMTLSTVILVFLWCFFYYLDGMLNLRVMLDIQDDYREMMQILAERTLFVGLDVRLEEAFECLNLQLIRNPLEIKVAELYSVTRSTTMAMFGNLITHSIFLIQYDMEHY